MNKIIILVLFGFLLGGCSLKKNNPQNSQGESSDNPVVEVKEISDSNQSCQDQNIKIDGQEKDGQMLSNCFIKYPEELENSQSYSITDDICGQFSPKLISQILGVPIIKTEKSLVSNVHSCSYYTNDKDYLTLKLNTIDIQDQIKFHQQSKRKIDSNDKIPLKNFFVYKSNNDIHSFYLVLKDNKFISFQKSIDNPLNNDQINGFASKLGEVIKDYQ